MINIKKSFSKSWTCLRSTPKVAYPALAGNLFAVLMICLLLVATGSLPLLRDITHAENEFQEQQLLQLEAEGASEAELFVAGAFMEAAQQRGNLDSYNSEADSYIAARVDPARWDALFTSQNLAILLVWLVVFIVGVIYLACMHCVTCALRIKNKDLNSVLPNTNARLFPYIGYSILRSAIIIGPLIVGVLVALAFSALHPILGVLFAALLVLGFIAYIIIISLKLLFSNAALFLDNKSSGAAIRYSWDITTGRMKTVFILGLLFYAGTLVIGQAVDGAYATLGHVLFGTNLALAVLSGLATLALLVVSSGLQAFVLLFTYAAYQEYLSSKKSDL